MKKLTKILLVTFAICLLCGFVCIQVFASDSEAASTKAGVTNSFQILDANGKVVGSYTAGATDQKAFYTALGYAKSGETIKLLGDMVMESNAISIPSKKVFIDLNGYNLVNSSPDNKFLFYLATANTELTFYSSDTNYRSKIFHSAPSGTNWYTGQSLFLIRHNNCHVTFGTPVRDASGNITGYTDCNIDTFTNNLINIANNGNVVATGSSAKIYGGNHVKSISTLHEALIQVGAQGSFYAKGANFYVTSSGYVYGAGTGTAAMLTEASATFEDCLLYSTETVTGAIETGLGLASRTYFKGCDFVCARVAHENTGIMNYENCRFTDCVLQSISSEYRINADETINVVSNTFAYENKVINSSSYDVKTTVKDVKFTYATTLKDYAVITWKYGDEVLTEKWSLGSILLPPIAPAYMTDACRYDFTPIIHRVSEEDVQNGVTYELKPIANFTVKANIALYSNFVYNIYVPKKLVDDGLINSAAIDNKPVTPSGTKDIDGIDYYVFNQSISAINGTEEFVFALDIDKDNDETFIQTYTFSIPAYADILLNEGNYSEKARTLVSSTITYIKAVQNHAATGELPYPVDKNPDLAGLANVSGIEPTEEPSEDFLKVFYGAGLSFNDSINIRFEIKKSDDAALDAERKNVVLTYRQGENSAYGDLVLNSESWTETTLPDGTAGYYYDLQVAARDLRDNIYITLGSARGEAFDYAYSIEHYIYANKDDTGTLKTLLNALYAYSIAAEAYIHNDDSVNSPTIIIGTQTLGADNYVIEAPSADFPAAIKLRDKIKRITGFELEIIATGTETEKNKISIVVGTPVYTKDFLAEVVGDDLVISSFASFIDSAMNVFINEHLRVGRNKTFDKSFTDTQFTDKVYYSDFGAVSHKKPELAANMNDETNSGTNIGTLDSDVMDTDEDKEIRAKNYKAIYQAHVFANNSKRHTVYADANVENPIYWIKEATVDGAVTTIPIKSNVNWTGVHFIIDNSCLNPVVCEVDHTSTFNKAIFEVSPDNSVITLTSGYLKANNIKLNKDSVRLELNLGYEALIIPTYSGHKVFRRKGYTGGALGSNQSEILVLDKYGRISEETELMFDYADLTKIDVYRIDTEPTLIEGGKFTTIASQKNSINMATNKSETYFKRSIKISRSNTTLLGVEHYTENEISFNARANGSTIERVGAAQNGFFYANTASHITLKNCVLTGQRCYRRPQGGTTGTYDFGAGYVNKIVLDGCVQSNFWVTVDPATGETSPATETTEGAMTSMAKYTSVNGHNWLMHWGIGGTNFCKNMEYIGSTLSRFDAHQGLYSGKIIDSTIQVAALTGMGDMEISNTNIYILDPGDTYNCLIHLRADYGCTWDGEIKVSDVNVYGYTGFNLVMYSYVNWYFGYQTAFPSLSIENLNLYYTREASDGTNVYNSFAKTEEINLSSYSFATSGEQGFHLSETTYLHPVRAYSDYDGDGFVDGYDEHEIYKDYDLDGDGVTGKDGDENDNVYSEARLKEKWYTGVGGGKNEKGDIYSYENLNPVKPPKYIYVSDADKAKYTFNLHESAAFFENTSYEKPVPVTTVNPFDTPVVGVTK